MEDKELQLLDSIVLVTKILCSKCDLKDELTVFDEDEAVKYFYSEGWRATDNHTYCPTCAKKFLKRKKKRSP